MGSPEDEAESQIDERPQHQVSLSPFLIAKCEVSQREWTKVVGTNPSKFKGQGLPVERVSWEDCQSFCQKTGLTLPTEAQWEYACRSGTATPFSVGNAITVQQVNHNGYPYAGGPRGELRGRTVPVKSFEPNGFGLHQMHGNVLEWCLDAYHPWFYSKSPDADPLCNSTRRNSVMRGGSWMGSPGFCRSACRSDIRGGMVERSEDIGFRPVYYPVP